MLPPNPLLQLTTGRIRAALQRLKAAIWRDSQPVRVRASSATAEVIPWARARRLPLKPVAAGEAWGRLFDTRWCCLSLPPTPGEGWYLHWRDQGEGTLYIDGTPYAGLDIAHRFCPLPAGVGELWVESTCVQSGIWHPEATGLSATGSVFDGAFLCQRDDDAWHAYYDLFCLYDLLLNERGVNQPEISAEPKTGYQAPVEKVDPAYRRLLRRLEEAVDALDSGGVGAIRRRTQAALREFRSNEAFTTTVLTGHAHIDLVWLWPERIGELKAVHTFATVNRLMSTYPEFRFAYSQPASYAAVGRRAPVLLEAVRRRCGTGKWEATGGMYVESDTVLPCGEGLVRSLVMGQVEFQRLTGRSSTVLWLPDVFGYSGVLPQLMRQSGVESFFTTKLNWSSITRFPYSSFRWRGADGTEVLAHITQENGYNTSVRAWDLKTNAEGHRQSDVHAEHLMPAGWGDGGGGPTDEMCELARRFAQLRGLPAVKWDQPEAFFRRMATVRDQLPVYDGELYLEYHRGTFTTHGAVKSAFRALERALQAREAAAVVAGRLPNLTAAWQRMIFAQFHDFIPGSSVPEVYHEGLPELARWRDCLAKETRTQLAARGGELSIFNPLLLPLRRVLPDGSGSESVFEVPPLSGISVSAARRPVAPVRGDRRRRVLENGLVYARLDDAGFLAELHVDGRRAALSGAAAVLVEYPDFPARFDAWDIDRQALSLGKIAATPARVRLEIGAASATFVVTRRLGKKSEVTTRYTLEALSAVLRIQYDLDWREPDRLLKLHFPTNYRGQTARFGAPFGSVQRPQTSGRREAEAMWEVPGSRYAIVTDDGEAEGLFVVTESKYGFSCRDGNLGVSLVRSPTWVGYDSNGPASPRKLSRLTDASRNTDLGGHQIRLAVGMWTAGARCEDLPAALAETLFVEPVFYQGPERRGPVLRLEGDPSLVPSWVQPTAEGNVVRLHEVCGRRGNFRLCLPAGWQIEPVNLLGKSTGPRQLATRSLEFRPYQVISLRLIPPSAD